MAIDIINVAMAMQSVGRVDSDADRRIEVSFSETKIGLSVLFGFDAMFHFSLNPPGAETLASRLSRVVKDPEIVRSWKGPWLEQPDVQVGATIMDDQRIALSVQVRDAAEVRLTLTPQETLRLSELLNKALVVYLHSD